MKNLKIVFVLIGFILTSTSYAQKPTVVVSDKAGWHKIGEMTADFKADKDELVVLGADKFKSGKIMVKDAPIHIEDMTVYYEDGTSQAVQLKSDFKSGGESRVFDLKNTGAIKKVVFVYSTVPNAGQDKATVELYGMK